MFTDGCERFPILKIFIFIIVHSHLDGFSYKYLLVIKRLNYQIYLCKLACFCVWIHIIIPPYNTFGNIADPRHNRRLSIYSNFESSSSLLYSKEKFQSSPPSSTVPLLVIRSSSEYVQSCFCVSSLWPRRPFLKSLIFPYYLLSF